MSSSIQRIHAFWLRLNFLLGNAFSRLHSVCCVPADVWLTIKQNFKKAKTHIKYILHPHSVTLQTIFSSFHSFAVCFILLYSCSFVYCTFAMTAFGVWRWRLRRQWWWLRIQHSKKCHDIRRLFTHPCLHTCIILSRSYWNRTVCCAPKHFNRRQYAVSLLYSRIGYLLFLLRSSVCLFTFWATSWWADFFMYICILCIDILDWRCASTSCRLPSSLSFKNRIGFNFAITKHKWTSWIKQNILAAWLHADQIHANHTHHIEMGD